MRNLLFIFLFCAQIAQAQFQVGENPGYYGSQLTDEDLYDLMFASGASLSRSTVDILSAQQYGFITFVDRLNYALQKGLHNNVFILGINQTQYAGRSTNIVDGVQSWLPASIDSAIFNSDGTVNKKNQFAYYCYSVVDSLKGFATRYEVLNEPDLTNFDNSVWATQEPKANNMPNMNDTIGSYIKLCKIAYTVIKKYQPTAIICTGGLGYPSWYRWFVNKGGLKWVDENSFHDYPYFAWTTQQKNLRNSDNAAVCVDTLLAQFRAVDNTKPNIMTETNVPRWSYVAKNAIFPNNKQWGSDQCQDNYTLKIISHLARESVLLLSLYQTGETADSGTNDGTAKSEIDAMGAYKKLVGTTAANAKITNSGLSMKAYTSLLGKYKIDTSDRSQTSSVDFSKWDSSGKKGWIIWAKCTLDTSETASGVYTFTDTSEHEVYDNHGNFLRICGDTIHLTGKPNFCKQHNPDLALIPPPQRVRTNTDTTFSTKIYPNPARDKVTIEINAKTNGGILIVFYNSAGSVEKFYTGFKTNDQYKTDIFTNFMKQGYYTVTILINGSLQSTKKIIILR